MITYNDDDHQYCIDNVPVLSVTQILDRAGLNDFYHISPDVLQRAAAFGKAVHTMIELYDKNNLDTEQLDPALLPYLTGWKRFLYDTNWATIKSEEIVYSLRHRYCGRLDNVGLYNDVLTVMDIKTSAKTKSLCRKAGIQLAGYKIAYNEQVKGKEKKIKQRFSLWLTNDGKYRFEPHKSTFDEKDFLSCLTVANLREEIT